MNKRINKFSWGEKAWVQRYRQSGSQLNIVCVLLAKYGFAGIIIHQQDPALWAVCSDGDDSCYVLHYNLYIHFSIQGLPHSQASFSSPSRAWE